MDETIRELSEIAARGDEFWDFVRKSVNDPLQQKVARRYTTQEAATLVGRADTTLRLSERRGDIAPPERDDRGHRLYSIEQLDELRTALNVHVGRREGDQCCVLGVITYKGGAGKTTTATSLAQYLTLRGYRTLLIDCDPQASCTSFFDYIPDRDIDVEETIYRILVPGERNGVPDYLDPQDMQDLVRDTHWGRLKLVPANLALYDSEMLFSQQVREKGEDVVTNRLLEAISTVENDYDVIVLDAPPSLGAISMNVVKAVDAIISPIQPSVIDFASNQQFLRMIIDFLGKYGRGDLSFYRILINNYLRHPSSDRVVDILRAVYSDCCMTATMGRTQEVNNAAMGLKTVYELNRPTGDNKTYRRALRMMNQVNGEIESLIKRTWPSYAREMEQED